MTVPRLPVLRLEDVAARLRRAVSPLALVLVPARAQPLIAFFLSSTPPPHLSALPPPAALFDSKSLPPGSLGRSRASSTPATSRSSRERQHVELPASEVSTPCARRRPRCWRAPPSGALREVSGQVRDATWYNFFSIFDSAAKQGRRVTTSSVTQTARGALHQGSGPCPSDSQPTWLCIAPASHAASVALTIPTPRPQSPTSRRKLRLRYDARPILSKPSRWTWDGALRIFYIDLNILSFVKFNVIDAEIARITLCIGLGDPLPPEYYVESPPLRSQRLLHTTTQRYAALHNQAGYYRHYGTTGKSGFADEVDREPMVVGTKVRAKLLRHEGSERSWL
ncbi:hypothetical protein DFH09DRAFT_1073148 [Mycena vulgaris]|nr:hypothetical protein DFH09DRAFT_1073148 [Mycena vulgaris]